MSLFPARMLLATDGSKESSPAVRVAVELAKGTGSELHVAHVVSTKPRRPYPRRWEKRRREVLLDAVRIAALALLEEKVRQVDEMGGVVAGSHYAEGEPEEEVARLAEELSVGLIVTGGRRSGSFGRLFCGGFAEAVFRRARCAVVVARGPKE
ncbi:MAG: universal stress protein [Actinomycetota bacterium]|nr:universal stress protein [Actinomycetota bacterium]